MKRQRRFAGIVSDMSSGKLRWTKRAIGTSSSECETSLLRSGTQKLHQRVHKCEVRASLAHIHRFYDCLSQGCICLIGAVMSAPMTAVMTAVITAVIAVVIAAAIAMVMTAVMTAVIAAVMTTVITAVITAVIPAVMAAVMAAAMTGPPVMEFMGLKGGTVGGL